MSVRIEWGLAGARALAGECDVVVCDVLSFSTAVSVATARGVAVYPHRWRDASADARAAELGAVLATTRDQPGSLSPPAMLQLPAGARVLLPSPNGATCCVEAAAAGAEVVVGCLRNAAAVTRWLAARGGAVGIVAAGEHWPDGSLRPAYEDWVGAGAIATRLDGLSAEAVAAVLAAGRRRPLADVMSGKELIDRGYPDDVRMAEEVDVDDVVPVIVDGCFSAG